jgi:hypothetical protein
VLNGPDLAAQQSVVRGIGSLEANGLIPWEEGGGAKAPPPASD